MNAREEAGADRTGSRSVAREEAPLWAAALRWELWRGRQVILTGQVRDRWWWRGRPVPFRTVLAHALHGCGVDTVAWWDPVGGLAFPLDGDQERYAALDQRSSERTSAARPVTGERAAHPVPEATRPPGRAPGGADDPARVPAPGGALAEENPTRRGGLRQVASDELFTARPARRLASVDDALAEAHRRAASPRAATAFVFEDIDLALPLNEASSVQGYLHLRAAMADAATPLPPAVGGDGAGPHTDRAGAEVPPRARNAVVAVVGDLSRVPAWLYREDPRTVVLHIGPPDQAERRRWFAMIGGEFNGGADAGPAEFEALVGATDGMAGWELDALARTSHIRRVPVHQPGRLLERHRINLNVDPWSQIDRRTVAEAAGELGARVIGQRTAVDAVVGALQAAYVGVGFGGSGAARPRGSFFFVGPTGVGKTELAKSVAQLIFGDPSAYARFDMSEYQQEHAAERLAGAPPGFIGYDQGGELTRRVRERPFSVLLFDEIEKAHPAVLDKFLQILEDGRLTDGQGRTAYFSQSLIIFTSNTGAGGLPALLAEHGGDLPYEVLHRHFTAAVEEKFRAIGRPEIYGRLKPGVVVFDMLRTEHVVGIADRLLGQLAESLHERHGVELVHDPASIRPWITGRMADPERQAYGGRQIRNEFEPVLGAVVRHVIGHAPPRGSRIRLGIAEDGTVCVTPDAVKGADGGTG
ncbi:AAA family ATPase [Streptomyces sp. BE303]|uniref:AAA family ATPase n=1 Tax=Streptomyces sp. BE303 TaxID=3002528 RepID=UPI002E79C6DF|nr:AAA family ATPase [Streptomyces sp. BE303]MED7953051.1 AAA family ATPase [Streptomyces sp. BE303]